VALIFISYRRDDSAGYAGRLHESLERRLGHHQVFRDVDALEPGQDFVQVLHDRIYDCRAFTAIIGREWMTAPLDKTDGVHADASDGRHHRLDQRDDYVRLEIEAALARPNLLVIPVLVEGVSMPPAEDLPESIRALSRRQAISLRDETWDADVDRLVAAVRKATATTTDSVAGGSGAHPLSRVGARPLIWTAIAVVAVTSLLLTRRFILTPSSHPNRAGRPNRFRWFETPPLGRHLRPTSSGTPSRSRFHASRRLRSTT
jgi:TIR domain-containing protein